MKYVRPRHMPPSFPLNGTLIAWLFVDRYNIDGVWKGVIFSFFGLCWIMTAVMLIFGEPAEPKWKGPLDGL